MTSKWIETLSSASDDSNSLRRKQFHRIGTATRRIVNAVVSSKAPSEELEQIASQIEAAADLIEVHPSGRDYEGFAEAANAGDASGFLDFSPISGLSNPIAPPIALSLELDEDGEQIVVGRVNYSLAYEGPPGSVHGGILAGAFDEVLGLAQSMSGSPGMTARLTINYRKPTPWGQPLRFEAKIVRRDGRKIYTEGRCYVGDVLTAQADALFITVDMSKLIDLAVLREAQREQRS